MPSREGRESEDRASLQLPDLAVGKGSLSNCTGLLKNRRGPGPLVIRWGPTEPVWGPLLL